MKLRSIEIENFRNYKKHSFEFDDKNFLILVGPNGAGKTNFLEAIYVLSLGRSFRSLNNDDLVEWDSEFLRCKCELIVDEEKKELEVFYTKEPYRKKNFKKNGVNLKNSEYIGDLITVLFHPEDLNMLYLSPSLRRKYLDIVLSQTDKKYLSALSKYRKTLKQRNALLQEIRKAQFDGGHPEKLNEDLDVWDEKICIFGKEIVEKRIEYINFMKDNLQEVYEAIADEKCEVNIEYQTKTAPEKYFDELQSRRSREILRGETLVGPHRDDVVFFLNKKEISKAGSRGEFRTLLLALKICEIKYIKERTGKNPILLLDDVFSELDRKRQKHLLKSIKNCQTIISTTDSEIIKNLHKEGILATIVEKA